MSDAKNRTQDRFLSVKTQKTTFPLHIDAKEKKSNRNEKVVQHVDSTFVKGTVA
jgi:hypothetical protein